MLVLTLLTALAAPDMSALTPKQRDTFDKVATEEFCGCASSLTLSGCNATKPDCKIADHFSRVILRGVQVGLNVDDILGFMSSRVSAPFCAKPKPLALEQALTKGPKDAKVTLVEFADFRCGHCREAAPQVAKAIAKYGKRVRFVFAPFPLQNSTQSVGAAAAMYAAGAQNKGWEMHEALFTDAAKDFEPAAFLAIAKRLGLDLKRFEADMASPATRDRVLAIKQIGLDVGVEATPTFFVNGRPFEPDPDLLTFADRFEMELDRNAGRCQ